MPAKFMKCPHTYNWVDLPGAITGCTGLGLAVLFLLICYSPLQAQQPADSLRRVFLTAPADTTRAATACVLCKHLMRTDLDSSLYYCQQGLAIAEAANSLRHRAKATSYIGIVYLFKRQYEKAIHWMEQAVELSLANNDPIGAASALNNIGIVHKRTDKFTEAKAVYERVLKIWKQEKSRRGIAGAQINIAVIHMKRGQLPQALDLLYKAARNAKLSGAFGRAVFAYNNVGIIFNDQDRYKKALNYFEKALRIARKTGDTSAVVNLYSNMAVSYIGLRQYQQALGLLRQSSGRQDLLRNYNKGKHYSNFGTIFTEMGQLDSAKMYLQKAIRFYSPEKNATEYAHVLSQLASILLREGAFREAIEMSERAIAISRERGVVNNMIAAAKNLEDGWLGLNRKDKAYDYRVLYENLQDSLRNEEKLSATVTLEARYDFELARTRQQMVMQEMKAQQEQERSRRNRLIYLGVVSFLVLVGALTMIVFRQRGALWLRRALSLVLILLLFEFLLILLDPEVDALAGDNPLIKLVVNFLLAMALLPLHTFLERRMRLRS